MYVTCLGQLTQTHATPLIGFTHVTIGVNKLEPFVKLKHNLSHAITADCTNGLTYTYLS